MSQALVDLPGKVVINLVATGAAVGRQQAGVLIQRHRQPVMDAGVIGQLLVEPGNLLGQLELGARQRLDQGDVGGLAVTEDHDADDGRAELGLGLHPLRRKVAAKGGDLHVLLAPRDVHIYQCHQQFLNKVFH